MKSATALVLVLALALCGLALATVPAAQADANANAASAPTVDVDALFEQYLKLKGKLAQLDAPADPAAPATDVKTHAKNSRKVEEKRAALAALEQQLASLNVNVVAKEAERQQLAVAAAQEEALNAQFQQAWINKLRAAGRAAEADRETEKLTGVKHRKAMLSPAEKAKDKIARLQLKLEREQYRVSWLEQAAKQQQQQQVAARAACMDDHDAPSVNA